MVNIVKDLALLTTIPDKTLAKFFRKMSMCICEAVQEDALDENNEPDVTVADIGIGKLYIKRIGSELKYKFEPSDYLSKALANTLADKENPLVNSLDASIGRKFTDLYKELC